MTTSINLFQTVETKLFAVVTAIKEQDVVIAQDDFLFFDGTSKLVYLVERTEIHRPRPILEELRGRMVRFEFNVFDSVFTWVNSFISSAWSIAATKPKLWLVVPKGTRPQAISRFCLPEEIVANRQLLARIPIYMGISSNYSFSMRLGGTAYGKDEIDGVVCYSPLVSEVLVCRIESKIPGQPSIWSKGLVSPPVNGFVGYCVDADFGRTFPVNARVTVHVIGRPSLGKGRHNLLAVQCTAVNPAGFIAEENRRLEVADPLDFVPPSVARKAQLGAPLGAFLLEMNLFDLSTRYPIPGGVGLVLHAEPTGVIPFRGCGMTPAMLNATGFEIGDVVSVLRNPALSTGGCTLTYRLTNVIVEGGSGESAVLYLNPLDPSLSPMKIDFDGDPAVVWKPQAHEVWRKPLAHEDISKAVPKPITWEVSLDVLFLRRLDSIEGMVGSLTLLIQRLIECGLATDDLRVLAADLVQLTTMAQKHWVHLPAFKGRKNRLDKISWALKDVRPKGFLIDLLNAFKHSPREADRSQLFDWECGTDFEIQSVYRLRLLKMWDDIVQRSLEQSLSKDWSDDIKDAVAGVEVPKGIQDEMKSWHQEWKATGKMPSDDDTKEVKIGRFQELRRIAQFMVEQKRWTSEAVVRFLPPKIAVQLVPEDWLVQFGLNVNFRLRGGVIVEEAGTASTAPTGALAMD